MSERGMWAVVEIMGHRVRAGLCSDAQIAAATFLKIEHPVAGDDVEPAVEYYAPSSIFAVRPCTQEEATAAASMYPWPARIGTRAPFALEGTAVDGFEDDYDCSTYRECRECGCTDDDACVGGCDWIAPNLCSRCAS